MRINIDENTVKECNDNCAGMCTASEIVNTTGSDCLNMHRGNNHADDSEDSNILYPAKKRVKRLVIEDDTDEEGNTGRQLPEQWIWDTRNNNPKVWKYTETPGIRISVSTYLDDKLSKLDMFYTIFDNAFWEMIIAETNRYAEQIISDENRKRKIDENWVNANSDEIKSFCALCIIITHVRKPSVQMYWSKRAVIETPVFGKVMSFTRFLQIARFLHFTNSVTADDADPLRKLRPVIDFLNVKFKEIYAMEEDITIDESLMKFRSRVPCKQFSRTSRSRFGINIYKLCESASGYCYDFKIRTGKNAIGLNDGASENIVMDLSRSILNKGHTLYLDNLYSSPNLFLTLRKYKTNVVGSIRPRRNDMPKDLARVKLKEGECTTRSSNGVLAMKWNDKRDVYVISTKHETPEMIEQGGIRIDRAPKPKCIIDYNKGVIRPDRQDRDMACFPVIRKFMKRYRKIFFYIFDVALFNTFVLYKKVTKEGKLSYAEYRIDIAELLLETVQLSDYKTRGCSSSRDTPLRLQARYWAHFPRHIAPTAAKQRPSRACRVCTKNKKRSETTWECKTCEVALHVPHCFERYHTLQDY